MPHDLTQDREVIADEVMALLGTMEQVEPFSRRYPGFGLGEAYDVVARVRDLRRARGENPIGRKIGFTNRAVWGNYAVSAPIWNYVFDRTVRAAPGGQTTFVATGMPEPRIEPELVLHLARAPAPDASIQDLAACVDWVAPAFEIVYSIFPDWAFSAADAAAANGVHGGLVLGKRHWLSGVPSEDASALATFSVVLENDSGVRRDGHARNVLGGPLDALRFLIEEIVRYPSCEPLRTGEIVTTGTLTEAMPAVAGETWTCRFQGIDLEPLQLRLG